MAMRALPGSLARVFECAYGKKKNFIKIHFNSHRKGNLFSNLRREVKFACLVRVGAAEKNKKK